MATLNTTRWKPDIGSKKRGTRDRSRRYASLPGISYVRAFGSATRHFVNEDGFVIAGNLAFTAIFALFPFLIFLLSLAGFIGQTDAARESIELALQLAPPEVTSALLPAIDQIRNGTTPGLLTFGIVVALWVSSSGIEAARHALDRVYGAEDDQRSFIWLRLQSIALTIFLAGGILLTVFILVAGPLIGDMLEWLAQRQLYNRNLAAIARYGIGLMILLVLVVLLHRLLPMAPLSLRDILPGAILSVAVYAVLAALYSTYLQRLGGYNLTYGSLGGIVLTLFFFYISSVIFIFGAHLNGALRRQHQRVAKRLEALVTPELRDDQPPSVRSHS